MIKKSIIVLSVLFSFINNFSAQILSPVKWTYSVEQKSDGICDLKFIAKIDPTWHIYSQNNPSGGPIPTSFSFIQSPTYELIGKVKELSKAEVKHDESFGMDIRLLSGDAIFVQKIRVISKEAFEVKGTVEFQCCDNQKCIPPKDVDFSFSVSAMQASVSQTTHLAVNPQKKLSDITDSQKSVTAKALNKIQEDTTIKKSGTAGIIKSDKGEQKGSLWGFVFYSFLWGLAGVLTPCVYPMIPMTVSFFMRDEKKKSNGIFKGLFFGFSIVFIYTLIGFLVSLSILGSNFGNVLSSHWIPNLLFFLMFFVFAMSFFGMFEIVLPSSLVNAADKNAEKGGIISVFFMALTLIIVSFSCTGPIVGKILIDASQGVAARPIAGMFGYSLAFALPFTLFALFPSMLKKLPKSGGWLNSVKVVMAFVLLAFSLKFLLAIDTTHHFNILTREVYLSIWIVLTVLLGFYLLGKIKFAHDSDLKYIGVPRLMLVVAVFSFALYLIPGLFGSPLKSISSLLPPITEQQFSLRSGAGNTPEPSNICETPKYAEFLHQSSGLQGYFDLKQGLSCAGKLNKPVFLDIKGHTCSNCKEMEATVFSDARVLPKLRNDFVIITLYVDDPLKLPESEWVTSKYDGKTNKTMGSVNLDYEIYNFRTNTQPLYAILTPDGNLLSSPYEFNTDINAFLKFLDSGKSINK